ncbi:MFS transporter (macronuclear) [Tetrahymena thermophila SB210]|uniref:MFS transporter n=1 Tax=Tetrahymena thermophila (strain SB210) TaxID=312017 RepID=I7LXC7_TETTS|nr:MFS transporter [Tetrahymena thermophila SB210]EAS04378.1 MFS transporter [Tetrahymena thermophila SB210]|eukprot:XP_001024623.1 MFS transporter [Tetrahymena thermophila SB210]
MSFDDLVNLRIKLGKYQYIAIAILVMVDLNDGVQLVLMSFINPIIKAEWHISSTEVATLTSLFYLGTALGSCCTGSIADRYGRKIAIQYSSLALFLISNSFVLVKTVGSMGFVRVLYGFTYGFSLPLTTSMLSEIIPIQYRGKGLVFLNFFVSVGKLVGCILAMICLDSFTSGNWKLMMMLSSISSLFVFIASSSYLQESPRFLLATGKQEEGFDIIDRIIKINDAQAPVLSQEEKDSLKAWSSQVYNKEHQASILALFQDDLKGITIRMWICWFMENAMYFGQLVIMPFILGQSKKTFGSYFITILGEAPSIFLSAYIVDHPLLGRRNSLTICFGLSMVFHFFCYLQGGGSYLSLLTSVARFFMKQCYAMLYPFSTEVYPTIVRTVGFGMCGGVGRVGATLIPYLIFTLIDIDLYSPFLVFTFTSLFAMISSYTFPFCTRGRQLDHIPQKAVDKQGHVHYIHDEKHLVHNQETPTPGNDLEMKLINKSQNYH